MAMKLFVVPTEIRVHAPSAKAAESLVHGALEWAEESWGRGGENAEETGWLSWWKTMTTKVKALKETGGLSGCSCKRGR